VPAGLRRLSLKSIARGRFQFRLRTLLFLFLASVLVFAWLGRYVLEARFQRTVVSKIVEAGGSVYYDYQAMPSGGIDTLRPPPAHWLLRKCFGDDIFTTATNVMWVKATDQDIAVDDMLRNKKLKSLTLNQTRISPAGLKRLAKLTSIQSMCFCHGGTDQHLESLAEFSNLTSLELLRVKAITDEGLKSLTAHSQLKFLTVAACDGISDSGFQSISKLHSLRYLLVSGRITDESICQFKDLHELESLQLDGDRISDRSLETIGQMTALKNLALMGSSTKVTERALLFLNPLKSLRKLRIDTDEGVTNEGVNQLRKALPTCQITCWQWDEKGQPRPLQ
jgi:hypothetical protein